MTYLREYALQRAEWATDEGGVTTWLDFESFMREEFTPYALEKQLRSELYVLKQTGTVKEYASKLLFLELRLLRIDRDSFTQKTRCFMFYNGLRPEIKCT